MSETKRIAVVGACPWPVPQGSQVYMQETALAYQRAGHEVHLVVYGYGAGDDVSGLSVYRCAKLPFVRKTSSGPSIAKPLLDLLMVKALKRVVSDHSIDEVVAHNYEGLMVALAAGGRPITYYAHNAMSDELPYYFRGAAWVAAVGKWLDTTFPRRANRIVAPHDRLKDYLIECGCEKEIIEVVPPTIDTQAFRHDKVYVDNPPVLYTGNLDRYQNLDFLRRVMNRVRAKRPTAEWVVATASVGEIIGATMTSTRDFNSMLGVMQQDAVFVCPRTSWSGYPIKLLNALAAGLPVVCCESSAHPVKDGVNGLVIPDNDEKAFAEAILKLLNDSSLRRALSMPE